MWKFEPASGGGLGEVLPPDSRGQRVQHYSPIRKSSERTSDQGAAPPEERAARQGECERRTGVRFPPPPPRI